MSAPTADEIQLLVSDLPAVLPAIEPAPVLPHHVASIIDHTLLAPSATPEDIVQCCRDAVELGAATVCVNASMVAVAAAALQGSQVRPICTIGFPFGAGNTAGKVAETVRAREDGAQEIDMVQNVGLVRAGQYAAAFADVAAVAAAAKPAKLKVILETCFLSREEIAISTLLSCRAGADFVKTSTGYGTAGAQADEVRLMHHIASAHGVSVKASGGIRTAAKVQEMVANGAARVGASGTRAIVSEFGSASATLAAAAEAGASTGGASASAGGLGY